MRGQVDQAAQQAVYDATMAGLDRAVGLAGALAADPVVSRHLDAQVARCLDPRQALGAATAFVARVLATAKGTVWRAPL